MRVALGPPPRKLRLGERLLGSISVLWARTTVKRYPAKEIARRLEKLFSLTKRPATLHEAQTADEVVCALRRRYVVSRDGIERSIAAAQFCALRGWRVRWCWGFATPPVQYAAWIEAEGEPVTGIYNVKGAFLPLIVVGDESQDDASTIGLETPAQ